jgi:hypothetical protein
MVVHDGRLSPGTKPEREMCLPEIREHWAGIGKWNSIVITVTQLVILNEAL